MTKDEALAIIDEHKTRLLSPLEMLRWTWLRLIIFHMTDDDWDAALAKATEAASH